MLSRIAWVRRFEGCNCRLTKNHGTRPSRILFDRILSADRIASIEQRLLIPAPVERIDAASPLIRARAALFHKYNIIDLCRLFHSNA